MVEMIVDRGVDEDEYLKTSHAPEAKHCPFWSSEWQMGILCSIVQAAAGFLSVSIGDALDKLLVFEQTHAEADATPIYLRRALKMPERSPLAIVKQHRGNTARDTWQAVRLRDIDEVALAPLSVW